jgi:hypothetical protein
MVEYMIYKLTEGQFNPPAETEVLERLSKNVISDLPAEYLRFLRQHNGGEGFVGENYIVIWKGEEIADFNREYEVEKYAPGIILFGSDGGGEGYGFDIEAADMPIVRMPFIGMQRRYATPIAKNLSDMFTKLASSS